MTSVLPSITIAKLPHEIWTTVLNFAFDPRQEYFYSSRKTIINVLSEVSHDFRQLIKKLGISIHSEQPRQVDDLIVTYCCANGFVSLLNHALMNGARSNYQADILAARFGSLDCLILLEEHAPHTKFTLSDGVLNEASLHGHINIVKYLMSKGVEPSMMSLGSAIQSGNIDLVKLIQSPDLAIEKASYLSARATASGNIEMVKYIEQYLPLNSSSIYSSAMIGSIEILQYYLDKGFTLAQHVMICALAAEMRKWKYLKFALDHGAPMCAKLMAALAKTNAVELMRELRQKGCPWNVDAVRAAAKEGHFEALKYLIENGCPFTEPQNAFIAAFEEHKEATVIAASNNHIECLKYLIEIGAPMPDDIINKCINNKTNPATVKYLRERGCSWNVMTCVTATRFVNNNVTLLKYLHENDCPWDEQTTITAAREASVECLKYALDNGCPWSASTMDAAAVSKSLEILKICHQRGIPWTNRTCSLLTRAGVVEMLKYAHENGAPWTNDDDPLIDDSKY